MGDDVWIVMPAYNEGRVIADTLKDLRRSFHSVVVVDDCSTDDTSDLAVRAGAHVCRHPVNLGQGAALQTGMRYALNQGATIIVTFDADGQHSTGDAVVMVQRLQDENLDVVLASRFLGTAEGMSAARGALLKAATAYTRLTTGLALTDTHNGLRVLSRTAAETIRLRQNRMAHASEILEQIAAAGLKYEEHPSTVVYTDYSRAKGQRISGAVSIISDIYIRRLYR